MSDKPLSVKANRQPVKRESRALTRLRLWRLSQGWTLDYAAGEFGMSRASFGPIELGRTKPTPQVAARLKEFFGEDASELLKPVKPRDSMPVLRKTAAQ